MKYFLDTEFLEGTQKKLFGQTIPTIDLISIGIICEDGREYYAISKDFNLKEAWNRYDIIEQTAYEKYNGFSGRKNYWIRDNVLKPIYNELVYLEFNEDYLAHYEYPFSYLSMKYLLKKYGKSNKQIAEEIIKFTNEIPIGLTYQIKDKSPEFYGYYSDYDWVVFCWLFGKMIDLPKGFPMYCIDLKQTLDEKAYKENKLHQDNIILDFYYGKTPNDMITFWKNYHPDYPQQINEHNALNDAKWNFKLYEFLNNL